ncbi:unnamed protein product [Closterium sp. NIES-53]
MQPLRQATRKSQNAARTIPYAGERARNAIGPGRPVACLIPPRCPTPPPSRCPTAAPSPRHRAPPLRFPARPNPARMCGRSMRGGGRGEGGGGTSTATVRACTAPASAIPLLALFSAAPCYGESCGGAEAGLAPAAAEVLTPLEPPAPPFSSSSPLHLQLLCVPRWRGEGRGFGDGGYDNAAAPPPPTFRCTPPLLLLCFLSQPSDNKSSPLFGSLVSGHVRSPTRTLGTCCGGSTAVEHLPWEFNNDGSSCCSVTAPLWVTAPH